MHNMHDIMNTRTPSSSSTPLVLCILRTSNSNIMHTTVVYELVNTTPK